MAGSPYSLPWPLRRAAIGLLLAFCACEGDPSDDHEPDAGEVGDAAAADDAEADAEPPAVDADSIDDGAASADDASEDGSAADASAVDAEAGQPRCERAARCRDAQNIERCAIEPQSGAPVTTVEPCQRGAVCSDSAGQVECKLSGPCVDAESLCTDALTLASCAAGQYQHRTCAAGCVSSPLGTQCAAEGATRMVAGRVEFEAKRPNAELTDWGAAAVVLPARGMWILSYRGDQLIDAVATSTAQADAGSFRVRAANDPSAALVVMAVGADRNGKLGYLVADPGFDTSSTLHETSEAPPQPRIWSWRFALGTQEGSIPVRMGLSQGSAAAYVFDGLRAAFLAAEQAYSPTPSQSLIGWLGVGTLWRCGACYSQRPITAFGQTFAHQVRVDGSSDEGYWSDAVTLHELGHYVMGAFGFAPGETMLRYFGDPTNPGLAWSEGWATFFGSVRRNSSIYYDKQLGGLFWFDIAARHYAFDNLVWKRPSAAAQLGLTQLIDENEVAAMLWKGYGAIADEAPFLRAMVSPRLTQAPFERGYTRRTWTDPDHPEMFMDTGVSVPHLADFLDALRCSGGISTAHLDPITEPATYYPYASESPRCR